jgi:hypothetical protein
MLHLATTRGEARERMRVDQAYFILYVANQNRSAAYYRTVLDLEPILDVPGITEFQLRPGCVLALLPVPSARKLLGVEPLRLRGGAAREELYLVVDDPTGCHRRALDNGGTELSPMQLRDWGHRAAYSIDLEGHVLAFAEKLT